MDGREYNQCTKYIDIEQPSEYGPVAQLGERHNGIVEVKGSSPFRSTGYYLDHQSEWYREPLSSLSERGSLFVIAIA